MRPLADAERRKLSARERTAPAFVFLPGADLSDFMQVGSSADTCRGACAEVTEDFCNRHGGEPVAFETGGVYHVVALRSGWVWDWTARQFLADAPCPVLEPLDIYASRWDRLSHISEAKLRAHKSHSA